MVSLLPDIVPRYDGFSSRELVQADRARRRKELVVYYHSLDAQTRLACEIIDSQVTAEGARVGLDAEFGFIDYGMPKVNGSQAKAQILGTKAQLLASANNSRFIRRFGG